MARTVRLSDPSWSTADDYVLQRLMDRVQVLISSQCNGMHIEDVSNFLDQHDPRIRTDPHHHAYLLYGPRVVFAEDGQLKVEVRGLVYEPMAALVGNALVLELGDDGRSRYFCGAQYRGALDAAPTKRPRAFQCKRPSRQWRVAWRPAVHRARSPSSKTPGATQAAFGC